MISPQIHLRDRPHARDRTGNETSTMELQSAANCSSDRSLAHGILRQTARDLRRFSDARTAAQRELYTDAYTWLMANEFAWPCSFLNVCATLGLQPEQTRADLVDAAREPWYSHVLTVARNTANSFASIL